MKSDSSVLRIAGGPAPEAFQALFELLDEPVAVCDAGLRLQAANPAFVRFCGVHATTPETLLTTVAQALSRTPTQGLEEGASSEVEVELAGRGSVKVTLARRGNTVAVRSRVETGRLVVAERALLEQARTEGVLLDLSRSVAEATGEEELVAAVALGVKELFPHRTFCIRIVDARTGGLTSLYAEGRLKEGAHEPLVLKQTAVGRTHLDVATLPQGRVLVSREVPLLFTGTTQGVSAPLVASGQLFGAINMEYPEGVEADIAHDERVLLQLANQVAVAVRNAKLIDELTFVRKYLEDLLEKANALILVVNRDRQVVVFNQALSALTGFTKEEVLGKDVLSFIPETEQLRVSAIIAAAMHGESANTFETRLRSRGGEVRVTFATSTMLTPQSEVEGVVAIGQDITVIKELEKRIVHAEKLASIGQLAASVVHEINNPMTAVAAYSESLLMNARMKPDANPSEMEKLRKIQESSLRILRFTKDLVSYARPAKDKPERVQLNAILDQAVGYCEHVVGQAKVSVRREYGADLPPISAVRSNLAQVFVNLITNACHAMTPGGQVTLTTRREGQEVVAEVRDTGSGIDPKHVSRIFDPFFTTKEEGKGTGLGLSIVQGIVESHGGRITVASTLGEGTVFFLRLPVPAQ
ncbi:ATP-binding protein [Hyalangium versicolor]|uniref:ATP-binding protein n=1 Tax=Hyalangium versicolor TaxID=2861190 RepID=UPI001CC92296|nr:ATP-binding protein [Hyalangium versicolor]